MRRNLVLRSLLLHLSRDKRLPQRRQRLPRQQYPVGRHEVGVALDVVLGVEPGDHLLEEGLLLGGRARGGELGDPDGSVAASCVGVGDVALEVRGLAGSGVPVDGDEVDGAGGAGAEEALEPAEAHARVGAAVGHRRRAELGLPGILLHVGLVPRGGGLVAQVRLRGKVGLVEAEEVGGAGGDGAAGCGVPARGGPVAEAPEHRHEFEARGDRAAGARGPVVAPGRRGADEGRQEGDVVVGEATLARGGSCWCGSAGGG